MRFIFVGDIALGDHPKSIGFGFYSRYKKGIPTAWTGKIFPYFVKADLVFGNLEFPLGTEEVKGELPQDVQCKGIKKFAMFLKDAGFNVLNVANNHMYEHGIDIFSKTIECLRSIGIRLCGIPNDFYRDSLIKIADETVLILGWCDRPRQGFTGDPPYNELQNIDLCLDQIRYARTLADIVCVSLHWGNEFIQIPSEGERSIARQMIDCGANIVIGHHPHVLREIEEYHGGLIAYSLGNFISDMLWDVRTRETGCLFVEFEKRNIVKWKFHPAFICEDFFPVYMDENSSKAFMNRLAYRFAAAQRHSDPSKYRSLLKWSFRRHQALTFLFFIRNIWKYRPSFALRILRDAIASRIGC